MFRKCIPRHQAALSCNVIRVECCATRLISEAQKKELMEIKDYAKHNDRRFNLYKEKDQGSPSESISAHLMSRLYLYGETIVVWNCCLLPLLIVHLNCHSRSTVLFYWGVRFFMILVRIASPFIDFRIFWATQVVWNVAFRSWIVVWPYCPMVLPVSSSTCMHIRQSPSQLRLSARAYLGCAQLPLLMLFL